MVKDGGGGKLRDAREIVIVQIIAGVQTAAAQEGVLDAGGHQVTKAHLQIEVVQPVQQTALRVIGEVAQMVAVDLAHGVLCQVHELICDAAFLGGAVAPFQRRDNGSVVFLAQLPQPRRPRSLHRAGVGNVKYIFQMRSAAAFPYQRNA